MARRDRDRQVVEIEAYGPRNLASAANGAVATASSTLSTFGASNTINGDRLGNARWADDTSNAYPDWVQVEFAGSKTISEIDIFGLQQDYGSPVEPTLTMTSSYALTNFEVQYWTGSAWATVPDGSVTGNNKVWRKFTFPSLTTNKIRVHVSNVAGDNRSQVVEVEAYGPPNVALAAHGAVATASSTVSTFVASNANNGDHVGSARWADDTSNAYPDWIQVEFAGSKSISEIDVFGLQQNHSNPVEPTSTMTSTYALTNFEVQYWTGSTWTTVPGGSVSGNDKVWRKLTFAPLTTSKIRVNVTNVAGDNRSQVVEIEAYAPANEPVIQWLVSDHLGTPRMIIGKTGTLANIKRHDYLPFGEELLAPAGGRTTALGYASGDGIRQQFTSQERDVETGLDYFNARYYMSMQGRFTSPDPTLLSVNGFNPQTWNRYTYVLNNPLIYIDPLGLWALQTETIYKKDKDGNPQRDSRGRLIVDHVVVTAVRTSDQDTGESLAEQLGLTGDEAESFAQSIGSGNNIRLSEQGGRVEAAFEFLEERLKQQATFDIEHPDGQGQGPDSADCSQTAYRMAFPLDAFSVREFSVQLLDQKIGTPGSTTSVQEGNLRVGDIVRWADARNNPKHFATVVFRDDDGVPVVFSKSGGRGPYEISTTSEINARYPGYGTIKGINSGQTGYYHPR